MTEWFDLKMYREAVEPLMYERMRKRLVSRESPDTSGIFGRRCGLPASISIISIIFSTIGGGSRGPG